MHFYGHLPLMTAKVAINASKSLLLAGLTDNLDFHTIPYYGDESVLSLLNSQGIRFITLRRRGKKLIGNLDELSSRHKIHITHDNGRIKILSQDDGKTLRKSELN